VLLHRAWAIFPFFRAFFVAVCIVGFLCNNLNVEFFAYNVTFIFVF